MSSAAVPCRCIGAVCIALLAACAQSGAPVVDKPVSDWSATAAKPAAQAPATPKEKPPVAAPSAPQPAVKASPAASAETEALPDMYVVKRGDTLYGIALDHGQSYRDVATWNGISDANVIQVGQQLRVRPPPGWVEKPEPAEQVVTQAMPPPPAIEAKPLEAPAPPPVKSGPKAVKLAYSDKALAQLKGVPYKEGPATPAAAAAKPGPGATAEAPGVSKPEAGAAKPPAPVRQAKAETSTASDVPPQPSGGSDLAHGWAWPARGALLHPFNTGANPKGIAIGGEPGQAVLAAAPGKVVYSGSGLRGYGKLIIIKHDDTFLSVYAHNRELLVKEGQRVNRGQKIAEMGDTDADRVGLHFEIRRLGKPVDPLQYLPSPG